MKTEPDTNKLKPEAATEPKQGFFSRVFTKLDNAMKEKADAKAQNNCCSGDSGKGGKCC
ncbi:hypothetical protein [Coraliomargarita akajimensis]|uniref:Uncharacterized protein n=1 Tax=Coraliomargarita akajimensis (strain DSM 45221 / IAM 15411 / JCM 23193 / KCTC 12865 / 04OKA010-24) TaxID=583355 RepID=D5EK33_CORAD|nr:hypothetical protein [Coraliomargarita akajimensis]ADE54782.1 hypothetical protein Caka_1763 [Coraliomargarita akajimensis DSM 45221]